MSHRKPLKYVASCIKENINGTYTASLYRGKKRYVLSKTTLKKAMAFKDEIERKYPSKAAGRQDKAWSVGQTQRACQKLISRLYVACEKCERVTHDGRIIKYGPDSVEFFTVMCPKCAKASA